MAKAPRTEDIVTRIDETVTASKSAICRFVFAHSWEETPTDVAEKVVLAVIDTLAAMIGGAPARSSRIAAAYAAATFAAGPATLVAGAQRTIAEGAGFANAVATNAYDIDDVGIDCWGHPGAQVFPCAFALAEEVGATGEQLLAAVLVGYEIACRMGLCLYADVPAGPERDYPACASWGAVACAAVCARLLGLDEDQTWEALGIAEYHAPSVPLLRDVHDPAMVKHGHGVGVLTGITAGRLAKAGFTGIPSLLGHARFRETVAGLGNDYRIRGRGVEWKRFACCWWAHPALCAVERLLAEEPFRAEDVEHIVVEAHHDSRLLYQLPAKSTEEAQFSVKWPLAALIAEGEVGIPQIDELALASAAIRELAARVEIQASAELDRLFFLAERNDPEGKEAARVLVHLRDGRHLDSGVVSLPKPDDRDAPWTREKMRAKFSWTTRHVLDAGHTSSLLGQVESLATLEDVRALGRAIRDALSQPASGQRATGD